MKTTKATKVRDLMTTEVVTLEKHQAIPLAQELMRMMHVRHLPVLDDGVLVGMVTHRGLLGAQVEMLSQMATDAEAEKELSVPVAKVMTTKVLTVGPEALVTEALKKMLDARQGCVVVIDDNKIVGVLTSRDFLRCLLHQAADLPSQAEAVAKLAAAEAVQQALGKAEGSKTWSSPRSIVWALCAVIAVLVAAMVLQRPSSPPPPEEPTAGAQHSMRSAGEPGVQQTEAAAPSARRPSRMSSDDSRHVDQSQVDTSRRAPRKTGNNSSSPPAERATGQGQPIIPPGAQLPLRLSANDAAVGAQAPSRGREPSAQRNKPRPWIPEPVRPHR